MGAKKIAIGVFILVFWVALGIYIAKRLMPALIKAGKAPRRRFWRAVWIAAGPFTLLFLDDIM